MSCFGFGMWLNEKSSYKRTNIYNSDVTRQVGEKFGFSGYPLAIALAIRYTVYMKRRNSNYCAAIVWIKKEMNKTQYMTK